MSVYHSALRYKLISVLTLSLLLVTGSPALASAHELKVDGDISAVMHTDPDDDPVTGSPTKFFIEFDDSASAFSLPKCTCTVSILENGAVLTTKKLTVSNKYESDGQYTFRNPGTYTMRFAGVPTIPTGFQPFVLNYEVSVSSGVTRAPSMPTALWVGIGAGIGLILVASYATNQNTRRKI